MVKMEKLDMDVVLKVLEVVVEQRGASLLDVAHSVRSFDTAHRYVNAMVKMGLIERRKVGRRIILTANSHGVEVYRLLKKAKAILDTSLAPLALATKPTYTDA